VGAENGHCCTKRDRRRSCFWQRSGWMPESGISCIYRACQYKNLGASVLRIGRRGLTQQCPIALEQMALRVSSGQTLT
jgi:hypothetical protein